MKFTYFAAFCWSSLRGYAALAETAMGEAEVVRIHHVSGVYTNGAHHPKALSPAL